MEQISNWNGYSVDWYDNKKFILSKKNKIYIASELGGNPKFIGKIKLNLFFSIIINVRLLQRLFRLFFYNVLYINSNTYFVSFGKKVGFIVNGVWSELKLIRPTRILRDGVCVCPYGNLFFGEYLANPNRDGINIYKVNPITQSANVIYKFKKNTICHVHSVNWDMYNRRFICLTGDFNNECKILYSKDFFKTVQTIGSGSETWRAVSVFINKNSLEFATDAEFAQNYIYRYDILKKNLINLGEIKGPVYYSHRYDDNKLFAVAAEKCPSFQDPKCILYLLKDDKLNILFSFENDISNAKIIRKLFLTGNINFPSGPGLKSFCVLSMFCLKGVDNQVYVLSE